MNLGYACINLSLGDRKITTNRSLTKKTFDKLGSDRVSELALKNTTDLLEILKWNHQNGVKLFRISSELIPRGDMIKLSDLKDFELIKQNLKAAGDFAHSVGQRLTFHPGPFNVLPTKSEAALINTITNLEMHGLILDLLGTSNTPYNKINIHCNGVHGDKEASLDRFSENFKLLSDSVRSRLTVENDDKAGMYSVKDLMRIHEKTGIPIVMDYHHHKFCTGGLSEKDALELAISTWPKGITPIIHYSESAVGKRAQAHSDYIKQLPQLYGYDVDVMVEAKMKEKTILPWLTKFNS